MGLLIVKHPATEQAAVGFMEDFNNKQNGHFIFLLVGKNIKRKFLKVKESNIAISKVKVTNRIVLMCYRAVKVG